MDVFFKWSRFTIVRYLRHLSENWGYIRQKPVSIRDSLPTVSSAPSLILFIAYLQVLLLHNKVLLVYLIIWEFVVLMVVVEFMCGFISNTINWYDEIKIVIYHLTLVNNIGYLNGHPSNMDASVISMLGKFIFVGRTQSNVFGLKPEVCWTEFL